MDVRDPVAGLLRPLGVAAVVIGLLLVLPLVVDAVESGSGARWSGVLLVVVAAGVAVVLPSTRLEGRAWWTALALLVLAVVGCVAVIRLGDEWRAVWLVLAIAVGSLVRPGGLGAPVALAGVAATALGASLVSAVGAVAGVEAAWASALTVALSGGSTVVLVLLLTAIRELHCAREELARAAVAHERDRMSRDLHDLLGHTLSLVVVKGEAVRRLVRADPDAAAVHAAEVEQIGRRALAEVRESLHGSRRTSLVAELSRARNTLEAAGVEATVSGALPLLPERVDEALAHVVREGVTNVVRHADAGRVELRVGADDGHVRVEVRDDGRGDARAERRRSGDGSGLAGLRQRLDEVGGDLEAGATEPGFRVAAVVPLEVLAR